MQTRAHIQAAGYARSTENAYMKRHWLDELAYAVLACTFLTSAELSNAVDILIGSHSGCVLCIYVNIAMVHARLVA